MAAPHVSGAAALMLQARPHLSPCDVKALLMEGAMDLGPDGFTFGAGRLLVNRSSREDIVITFDETEDPFPDEVIVNVKHMGGLYGITVNAVSPSTTLTPRVKKLRDPQSLKRIAERAPLGHLVEPQDCAEAVLFLASDGARHITGTNLNVNAGILMI